MECLPGKVNKAEYLILHMLSLKEINKKLEEFKSSEDKINYLNKLLKEINDKELVQELKRIIKDLEESLENKLEQVEIPQARKIIREIDLNETEQEAEEIHNRVVRQRIPRQQIINEDREIDFSYSSVTNYENVQLYNLKPSDYNNMQNSFEHGSITQRLIRENILNPLNPITEVERENLSNKLREMMPGIPEEKILIYRAQIEEDIKKNEKIKYIPRLI